MKVNANAVLIDRKAHKNFSEEHPTVALYFAPERANVGSKFSKFVNSSYTTAQSRFVMTIELDSADYELNKSGFREFCTDFPKNEVWQGVNLFSYSVSALSDGKFDGFFVNDKDRVSRSRYIASFDENDEMLFEREKRRFLRQIKQNKIHGVVDEVKTEEEGEED